MVLGDVERGKDLGDGHGRASVAPWPVPEMVGHVQLNAMHEADEKHLVEEIHPYVSTP